MRNKSQGNTYRTREANQRASDEEGLTYLVSKNSLTLKVHVIRKNQSGLVDNGCEGHVSALSIRGND